MKHPDVIIIGAGISGVSAALELAESGVRVTVIERYQVPAAMGSGWTLAGVRQSGRDPAELPLARHAINIWKTLNTRLEANTGYVQSGNMRLARNKNEFKIIRNMVDKQKSEGLSIEFLTASDIESIAPLLSSKIHGASYCASDGKADPKATVNAFKNAAQRKGVKFKTGVTVENILTKKKSAETDKDKTFYSIETTSGEIFADTCILAAGVETNILLKKLQVQIPLTIPVVSVIQTTPLQHCLNPVIGVANADLAIKQQIDGKIIFSSGAQHEKSEIIENNGEPLVQPPVNSISQFINRANNVLPNISKTRIERIWGGLIDLTPDALPIIDYVPGISNLIVAAGFSGHGFGIGPTTGKVLANLALNQKPEVSLVPFNFKRASLSHFGRAKHSELMHG